MTHTPGKWVAETGMVWAQENNTHAIADCQFCGNWPEEEANARLIAAAPDLLEALESAEDALSEHCPGLTYLLDDVISPAIAKARGETA